MVTEIAEQVQKGRDFPVEQKLKAQYWHLMHIYYCRGRYWYSCLFDRALLYVENTIKHLHKGV